MTLPCLELVTAMSAQKDRWVSSFSFLLFCASSIPRRGSARLLQELSPQEYFSSLQAGRASLAYFSHHGTYLTVCVYTSLGFSCEGVCESGTMKR